MPDKHHHEEEFGQFRQNLVRTLAHHDSAITSLTTRMGALETKVDDGFQKVMSKLEKQEARPQFDFAKAVSTVLQLAILLGMTITGIIWVTTGQFGATVAKQDSHNALVLQRLDKHDVMLDRIAERAGWSATTKKQHDR